jgi:sarcosine oxidase/L-pipecolate oxidase
VKYGESMSTVAVIGGGIIGSWTALHLVEAGVNTSLIEQFPLPHTRGSSHGLSRAFRFLGDPELDRLEYSMDQWLALEKSTGESLYIKTGLLNFGPPDDPVLEKHMAVVRDGGRPCEWLDSKDIASRFPMLHYPQEWGAAWDPNGGILIAHRCLDMVQSRFKAAGGRIITARVESVESIPDSGVRIRMRSDISGKTVSSDFDSTVVCAGPWTGKLLPQLSGLLSSLRTPVTYWHDPSGSCSAANGFPILFNARLTGVYGLPSCEYEGLVKILFHGGPETDPDTRDLVSFEPHIKKISDYVREHLPQLDYRQAVILESCMYTMTPDNEPIIDRLSSNVVVGCGFSGSGFKHSPATGKMLAAMALDKGDLLPQGFRADRYVLNRFHRDGVSSDGVRVKCQSNNSGT